ncbi:hypothetical protein GGTG_12062 [Gaeumannomyces tritici R3-111a-1]|uniref:Uncharacterized protein n=1 Tax=Gaeumannomyces tritici (strain R3-111a-1) TaxID=644352 RepID=J3PEY3_GAET3|nr:hypothetical protein GGTG_12062 [Gaeumannomyces tritici R3-111a-1]EJT71041.1 hypothetical protein GGTG_12062 [Gaeumannomyces tritici R3-111a-1]
MQAQTTRGCDPTRVCRWAVTSKEGGLGGLGGLSDVNGIIRSAIVDFPPALHGSGFSGLVAQVAYGLEFFGEALACQGWGRRREAKTAQLIAPVLAVPAVSNPSLQRKDTERPIQGSAGTRLDQTTSADLVTAVINVSNLNDWDTNNTTLRAPKTITPVAETKDLLDPGKPRISRMAFPKTDGPNCSQDPQFAHKLLPAEHVTALPLQCHGAKLEQDETTHR